MAHSEFVERLQSRVGELQELAAPDGRTWPQRPTERVPERTGLPQPMPSCTG